GFSTYIPRNYNYKSFLNKDEFAKAIERSDLIISHGGTGSIIAGVKKGLKVICIPRDMKYGEHVDNHQYEIVEQFAKTNMILGVYKISDLKIALTNVKDIKFKKYFSNTEN
ncbi:glycosyltransferase, partial [Micrococcus sp. SIMBA_131]